ncbi:hypothetical protein O181_017014 [Austropuccinia psidii MF-1]|uniref:Uncharacterized protein n=1 Tax=Austropuccinia psidii MF-1 TaxID=1389203 RepID=A0A9Q3C2R9_9BASI|nr:hypothetical protein [Austropuccinia psidii MF-1]
MENKPFIHLKPSLVQNLNHQSLSQNLEKISNIERLNVLKSSKWQNEIILALRIRSLDCFLDSKWVNSFPMEACKEEADIFREGSNQVYYWIILQMNQENQDKFYNREQEKCDPAELWGKVREYYASSSAENFTNVIVKIFNLKMDKGNVLEIVGEFQHFLNLICMIGTELFREDILLNIMAFYSLKLFPSLLQLVANNVYQATKLSGKIPTLEEVFSEVELTLSRRVKVLDNAEELKVQG